ncbi:unnamed protein product, partial [Tetraodon nigroviridis]
RMGSFRRPRPRFMSSPVLSDLARFHASSPAVQLSNASVWNRKQQNARRPPGATRQYPGPASRARRAPFLLALLESSGWGERWLADRRPPKTSACAGNRQFASRMQKRPKPGLFPALQTPGRMFGGVAARPPPVGQLSHRDRCSGISQAGVKGESVQTAVVKVFQGGALQANELYSLNESIRWLLKTEMGSFIADYFQVISLFLLKPDQPLIFCDEQLAILADAWVRFFTEVLPTLQAIFYPVQGQELTVRQMALLAFRDLVLLNVRLEEPLGTAASVPPAVTQMLLVLQGVHESGGPSLEYYQLERLVELVVSPYLSNVLHSRTRLLLDSAHQSSGSLLSDLSQPEITVSQHHHSSESSFLAPLVEQEGEVYLEKAGGVRRHTVANVHSHAQLLAAAGRVHAGM